VEHDVERRPLLVEPAGEGATPVLVRTLDVELDEGAGELIRLPRRGFLARAQPHDDIAGADRLAGAQGHVAADAVALVEDAENGDALRHRRRAGIDGAALILDLHGVAGAPLLRRWRDHCRHGARPVGTISDQVGRGPRDPAARHQDERADRERALHPSGLHAS
jgi:hypothetical protein